MEQAGERGRSLRLWPWALGGLAVLAICFVRPATSGAVACKILGPVGGVRLGVHSFCLMIIWSDVQNFAWKGGATVQSDFRLPGAVSRGQFVGFYFIQSDLKASSGRTFIIYH